jgi:hypothetical protein
LGYESKDKVKLLSLQVAQQRRGAAHRGEYRQAAGAIAPVRSPIVADQNKPLSQKSKTGPNQVAWSAIKSRYLR